MRLNRELTLEELAEGTGFNKSHLSKIENAKTSPPIATLSKIAAALGVSIGDFFREQATDEILTLTKANETVKVVREGNLLGYTYESLNPRRRGKAFDAFLVTFPPRKPKQKELLFDHEGEEMIYVLKGELNFTFNRQVYRLKKGDCVQFDASYRHNCACVGRKEAKGLLITWSRK